MLNARTLRQINERPKDVNRLPLLAAGGGSAALAALLYMVLALPLPALAALLVGTLLVLVLHRSQKARTTVPLTYEGKLDGETRARFDSVSRALEGLASSGGIHHLRSERRSREGEDTLPPERGPAGVGLLETPGIRADVPVWGVEAGGERLLFFPEGVLRHKNDRYEGIAYGSLRVGFPEVRFFEGETVLEIGGPRGLSVRLEVPDREAAARFGHAFGAGDPPKDPPGNPEEAASSPGEERGDSSRRREEAGASSEDQAGASLSAEVAEALGILGLEEGASMAQIGAAYKRMARTYHPDKVAGESVQIREYAEEKMKEVNAAYSTLKLRGRDPAAVGTG